MQSVIRDLKEPLINGMVKVNPISLENRFVLSEEDEATIREITPHFGYGVFSELVCYRTYSHMKSDGNKESFSDIIVRVINGLFSIRKNHYINNGLIWNEEYWSKIAVNMGQSMLKMHLLPSGRALFICGREYGYKFGGAAFNNCGFVSTLEGLVTAATWTFSNLMSGAGIGYDTRLTDINVYLPGCSDCRFNKERSCSCHNNLYVIHDSKEGWTKSLYLLLNSYLIPGSSPVHFDYSELRAKGEPIKGFGGVSSGHQPLFELHENIRFYMECFIESKTNVYDAVVNLCRRQKLDYPGGPLEKNIIIKKYFDGNELTLEECNLVGFGSLIIGDEDNARFTIEYSKSYGTTRLITDIFNQIGVCVVSGNIRRSSEIALGVSGDMEFLDLKNHKKNPERENISWMSNNTVIMEKTEDFEDIPNIAERIRTNGEPGILNMINVNRFGRFGKRHPIGREAEPDLAVGVNPCCLSGDTLIQTSYGYRKVDQLIGKQFSTVVNGSNYWSTTAGFWSNGIKDVFQIELDNGCKIKLTDNHKLLIKNRKKSEWKETKDISINDKIVLIDNGDYKWDGIGTFIEGYFCGQLIGDGTFSGDIPRINLWMKDDVNPLTHGGYVLLEQFAYSLNPGPLFNGWRKDEVNNGYVKYALSTVKFKEISDKYGIYPLEKKVPEFGSYIFSAGLLRGFFDSDGTVAYTDYINIRLGQSNLERLESVQRLLFSMGIFSTIYKNRKNEHIGLLPNGHGTNSEYLCKAQHELSITGSSCKKYLDNVGFFEIDKHLKLYNGILSYTKGFYNKSYTSKIKSVTYIGKEEVYDCTIPGPSCFSANGIIAHNCEVNLESFEFCNLAEIFPTRCETEEEMENAARLATLFTSTVSLLQTQWSQSNQVIARNRRTGVSISGIADLHETIGFTRITTIFDNLYKIIRKENKRLSVEAGVPESLRVTSIKPSGTLSLLVGTSPGIHFPTFNYCIRTIRIASNSELVPILESSGYIGEVDFYSGPNTLVFSFPLYCGSARSAESVSIWLQSSVLQMMQRVYADNCVSCTLYYNPETESGELEDLIAQTIPCTKSLSVLPHTKAGVYKQSPYQFITKEQYEELIKDTKPINWNFYKEEAVDERGCNGSTCELNTFKLSTKLIK